jgi:hypothetical protein
MFAMVVYESMWGNTKEVAEAIASGLGDHVTLHDVADAPARLPVELDLLVVGGPTHAFSMTRASTRRDAAEKGASGVHVERGIRDWIDEVEAEGVVDVATFDTRVGKVRHLPGSAAKAAGRHVRHHLGRLVGTESFWVEDMEGPLLEGELERARAWGATLAAHRAAL